MSRKMTNKLVLFSLLLFTLQVVNLENQFLSLKVNQNYLNFHKSINNFSSVQMSPGQGWSSDNDSISPAVCYNALSVTKGNQSSVLKFESSVSTSSLKEIFNVEANLSAGYSIFKGSSQTDYFNQIKDDEYSFSINYYYKVSQTVSMTYSFNPETILSEVGQGIYRNGENPQFRLFCGDHLIDQYEEGAGLIYTIRINFTSKESKKTFQTNLKADYSLLSATGKFEKEATNSSITATLKILAYQFGGDPTKLTKVLSNEVTSCSIENIASCQKTTEALLKYSSEQFSEQFEKDKSGIWMNPFLSFGNPKKGYKVSQIGLKLSSSFINERLKQIRRDTLRLYYLADYYEKRLQNIMESNILLNTSKTLIERCRENKNIIKKKGIDLYDFPSQAEETYAEILNLIDNTIEEKIYSKLEEIKYFYHFPELPESVKFVINYINYEYWGEGNRFVYVNWNNNYLSFLNRGYTNTEDNGFNIFIKKYTGVFNYDADIQVEFNRNIKSEGIANFKTKIKILNLGQLTVNTYDDKVTIYRKISPYYFDRYSPDDI